MSKPPSCLGVVPGTFTVCGEDPAYVFCSKECEVAHKLSQAVDAMTPTTDSYVTDRLAVGNVAVKRWLRLDDLATTGPRR